MVMNSPAIATRPPADLRFDTPRITAAIDALAAEHRRHHDLFRAAIAKLLKAELLVARQAAEVVLLQDRHGRRCAEQLCYVQDQIIHMLFASATKHLYPSTNHS